MIEQPRRAAQIAFFGLLAIIDWSLYFRHAGHFFQGDTVFLLNHRASSISGYFREFAALNPSGWFRPLTNELVESILFPIAGLHPVPYRIPVYALFIALTIAVYTLALTLTNRHLAAALATFFFTIHTTNAYITYDIAYMPDLLYALFYISAVLAFLRYLKSDSISAYRLSMVCFMVGLLSKEPAVTLPGTLFVAAIAFAPASLTLRERLIRAIRSTIPHALILLTYLVYAVGYLDVAGVSVTKLFDQSQRPAVGDYTPVFNGGVLTDASLALTWAFNIPRGWWGQWHYLSPGMVAYLKFFRALVLVLTVVALIRTERRIILFAAAWFWISLLPALPVATHFVPSYLFVPIVGLSVIVGVAFAIAYDRMRRFQPFVAAAGMIVIFGGVLYVNNRSIRGNIRDNSILGGSAKLAADTLNDVRHFYPTLPAGTTLYFADDDEPLGWYHDFGGLIKMAYDDEKIHTLYQSQGASLLPDTQQAAVFGVRNGRLFDETAYYRSNAGQLIRFTNSDLRLGLSTAETVAGSRYTLRISGANSTPARIAYTLNDGPLEVFTTSLNGNGEAVFDVSPATLRGVYNFWAFTVPGVDGWVRAGERLTVR